MTQVHITNKSRPLTSSDKSELDIVIMDSLCEMVGGMTKHIN